MRGGGEDRGAAQHSKEVEPRALRRRRAHADPAAVVVRGAVRQAGIARDVGQRACSATIASLWMKPPGGQDHPTTEPMERGPSSDPVDHADNLPAHPPPALRFGVRRHTAPLFETAGGESFHAGGCRRSRSTVACDPRYRERQFVKGIAVTAAEEQPASSTIRDSACRRMMPGKARRTRPTNRSGPANPLNRSPRVPLSTAGPRAAPEERSHVLRRVLEATGPLEGRATSQVDRAAGVGRSPPGPPATFDGPDVGPRLSRPHDRRRARAAPKPTTTTSIVSSKRTSLTRRTGRLDQLHLSPRTKARGETLTMSPFP